MAPDDRLDRNFRADLVELTGVADVQLPELSTLLSTQAEAHGRFEGVSPATMAPNLDSAFFALNATLMARMRRACTVVDATAEALHDIAQLYRRADGQG